MSMPVQRRRSDRWLMKRLLLVASVAALVLSLIGIGLFDRASAVEERSTIAATDDARSPDSGPYSDREARTMIGAGDGERPNVAGFLFSNVMVPAGAKIESVEFSVMKTTDHWQRLVVDLGFEATDNADPFSPLRSPANRTMTSAKAHVDENINRQSNQRYDLGSATALAEALQEVVDRPGWQPGNSVALIAYGPASPAWARQEFYTSDAGASRAPTLTISYQIPEGSGDHESENELVVSSLTLNATEQRDKHRLDGRAIVENDGDPVRGAEVSFTLVLPDGSTMTGETTTNRRGRANFSQSVDMPGAYELRVDDVEMSGYVLDKDDSVLSAWVTIDGDEPAATATETETETATETVTETATEETTATPTEEPTSTPTEEHDDHQDSNCGEPGDRWHPAVYNGCEVGHEHGDQPPAWADSFSMANFGHPVIYGGDEGTPNENVYKHNAFKGQVVPSAAGGEAYVRYHGQSNPHGRAGQFHSYELYYRDSAGNVSFFQGWKDCGDPNTARFPRSQGDPLTRPAMLVVDQAAWDQGIRTEQWYCHGPQDGLRLVEMGINIGNTSTIWHEGEHLNSPHDQSTWEVTGAYGNTRLVDFFLLEDRFDDRTGWFCLTTTGQPISCSQAGALPQYVAPTFYDDMRSEFGVMRISGFSQKQFDCTGCMLPN